MSPGRGRTPAPAIATLAWILAVAAAAIPVLPACAGEGAEAGARQAGPVPGGSVTESLSVTGAPASGASFGAATDLALLLDLGTEEARAHFEGKLSVLGGSRAAALWAQAGALEASGGRPGILLVPEYRAIQGSAAPSTLVIASLSQAYLSVSGGGFAADAGRLPVNFGAGKAFSPVDVFAARDLTGASPARLSSDVVRLAAYPSGLVCAEFVAAPFGPARNAIAAPSTAEPPLFAGRVSSYGAATASSPVSGAFMAARRSDPWTVPSPGGAWIAGGELKADLPFASVYAEAAYALADSAPGEWDFMAGIDTGFDLGLGAGPGDAILVAEYGRDASPAADSSLDRAFAGLSLRLDDWTSFGLTALWHIDTGLFSGALRAGLQDFLGTDAAIAFLASRAGDSAGGTWTFGASLTASLAF